MGASKPSFRPGNIVPDSGIYGAYRGGRIVNEVTSVQGEPFPPSSQPNTVYRIVRPTR